MRYFKFILFSVIFITYCLCPRFVSAQNISSTNVSSLSDSQIQQIVQQGHAAGLSDSQIVQQAIQRGLPADQAQILQNRISNVSNSGSNTSGIDSTQSRTLNYKASGADQPKQYTNSADTAPKIFGADLFRNSNLTFEPNLNLATPVNYIIGPNDQLNVSVYGNSLVNWKLTVSPEGNINIPGIGLLNVAGKSIEQVSTSIKSKLAANNYAVGHGTTVQVSLGNIRSIKVILVGEVQKPGTYTLPSLATVFNALYAAGGPNNNGSFRQIEVIRDNRIIKRLDVYDFLLKGEQKDNIGLQDQDIIRIPTYRVRVQMTGQVKNPALFEVLPGETLKDVIGFSGGFTDQAYTSLIKVSQISDQQRRITDVTESDYKNYIPLRGDIYTVQGILNRYENRVTIQGAVFRPGEYELEKGLTLLRLIQKAAGIKEDAFTGIGTITRLNPDNTTGIISFNLKDIINKSTPDISLQREDVVSISSIFDLRDKYTVTIQGAVRSGGDFAYADSMTVEDLIIKAGGFAQGGSAKRIEVARRVNDSDPSSKNSPISKVFTIDIDPELKLSNATFTLKPFDIVSVYILPGYETQRTVRVEGEVISPGYYVIKNKDEKISDIIARAGGLSASAYADGGTLKRNNTAILGVDKNKTDTAEIAKERIDRLARLQNGYKDSTNSTTAAVSTQRNDFVGIDLKKILENPGSNIDLLVEDGDEIRIPKQQQIVRVNGEVLYPSAVVFQNGKSFLDYVSNAGGFSPEALKRGAYVVYANGTVKGTRKFLFWNTHPVVKPGSEIYVPKKPAPKGNATAQVIGYVTALASLAAIVFGIVSLNK